MAYKSQYDIDMENDFYILKEQKEEEMARSRRIKKSLESWKNGKGTYNRGRKSLELDNDLF